MIKYLVVNLKARFQPMHRFEIEDLFLEYCQEQNLKLDVVGGGTLMSNEQPEPLECDIEIGGIDDYQITDIDVQKVAEFFKTVFAPKGSVLHIYFSDKDESEKIDIGVLEGLSLSINGTDLPDEVYENYDINFVVDQCNELIAGIGKFYSYCELQNTLLYFYGESFEKMKNKIMPFVNEYPLCQKCGIEQIA